MLSFVTIVVDLDWRYTCLKVIQAVVLAAGGRWLPKKRVWLKSVVLLVTRRSAKQLAGVCTKMSTSSGRGSGRTTKMSRRRKSTASRITSSGRKNGVPYTAVSRTKITIDQKTGKQTRRNLDGPKITVHRELGPASRKMRPY